VPTLVGAFIEEQRRLAGLSRNQLAARIGYTHLDKGSRRIVELEQWGEARGDLLGHIVAALQLDGAHVARLVAQDQQRARDAWERYVSEPVAPVLRYRVIPAIWAGERLPDGLSRDAAIAHARARAMARRLCYVLVWSRREEVWCYPDSAVTVTPIRFGEVAGPATRVR
jgi:hypothetical protein